MRCQWVWSDFGSLYTEAQGYVPVLLENLHGMSCSGACWPLGGAWFQCRYGGFWMSSCWLIFPGVRSSLVSSGFGLKPPASGFQSYSYSILKTSPSPFEDNGLLFWVPDVLCQHSEVVLWNLLSLQMFFQWICGEESVVPVLFLCHLRTTSTSEFYKWNEGLSFSENVWLGRKDLGCLKIWNKIYFKR